MWKRMFLMLFAVGLVAGGLWGFQSFKTKMIAQAMAAMANPPQTVAASEATPESWAPRFTAVGSLRAKDGSDLALEASGIVDEIAFESGARVEAGRVLLRLKADDDQAKLDALDASAELARINYDRDREQLKIKAVSQAVVDSDAANLKNARAQVEAQRATIAKKTLVAPFAGRLGIRNVDRGQFLAAGSSIVTLQSLDPIYVDFTLPQQAIAELADGQPITAIVDTWPGETFAGTITAINPKVDTATRNVQVRATIANPKERLLPGMFARVVVETGAAVERVTLPATAIVSNPYGDTVFLVKGEGDARTVESVFVKVGEARGDLVAVTGVTAGQTVVTAGQLKLRKGTPIKIDNSVQPTTATEPKPIDK